MDRKIKNAATAVIVIAIVAFSAYTMYDLNGDSFDFSGSEMRLIVTGSMDAAPQPYDIKTIPVNSIVMIKHMSQDEVANDLKVGDVVAFRSGGIIITHRIVSIDQEHKTLITKGDANPSQDSPVPFTSVVGKVVGVNHWMGIAVHLLRSYTISIILGTIGIVSGAIAIKSSLQIIREEKEEEKIKQESGTSSESVPAEDQQTGDQG